LRGLGKIDRGGYHGIVSPHAVPKIVKVQETAKGKRRIKWERRRKSQEQR
jgi:hypothetical protein